MRVLLVYCHPDPASFTAAVRQATERGLAAAGHEVTVADLYAEGFQPVLGRAERASYHTVGANEAPVAAELARLRAADALVFVYPTWWYAQPAMFKGWLDRVFVPHATFTMPEDGKAITGRLHNIRVLAVVTTLGAPRWWWWLMGAPGRRILLSGIGALCAPRVRKGWLALHSIDTADAPARAAFLARVERVMSRL